MECVSTIRPPRMCCWVHEKYQCVRAPECVHVSGYIKISMCFALKYGYHRITHACQTVNLTKCIIYFCFENTVSRGEIVTVLCRRRIFLRLWRVVTSRKNWPCRPPKIPDWSPLFSGSWGKKGGTAEMISPDCVSSKYDMYITWLYCTWNSHVQRWELFRLDWFNPEQQWFCLLSL